ncbi:MAG: NAD(P)H-hydrate dehydratase [Pseudomonadota bacterium]
MMEPIELLSTEQMAEADQAAVRAGVASLTLMETAGRAVADAAEALLAKVSGQTVLVLCGPGNNGGDGFVVARVLKQRGFTVSVVLVGDVDRIKGDARTMTEQWDGGLIPFESSSLVESDLIVDALFGAGLSRPMSGDAAAIVTAVQDANVPVVAVDVPSGVDGSTGRPVGPAIQADRTVTFFRLKPGHLLYPGRALCGVTELADIGIPATVLDDIAPLTFHNTPALWSEHWPVPKADGHKYARGHAVVVSGPALSTGAARLGARGALRIGAGLVTVASPADAALVNATQLTAIMNAKLSKEREIADLLEDKRFNSVMIGPGAGVSDETRGRVWDVLASGAATILDADALTVFEGRSAELFAPIQSLPERSVVLTPHEGEFARLFGRDDRPRLERVRDAAAQSGAIVVLKGPDTVIAAPDGRVAINANAPPWLATAGSGDVLAGFITGLLAQQMPAWESACSAVWMHGACATHFGPGLIAEDIPETVPQVLQELLRDIASAQGDNRGVRF